MIIIPDHKMISLYRSETSIITVNKISSECDNGILLNNSTD